MKRKTRKTPQTKRKGQAGIFGGKRSWLAMGTLAAYAAIGANRPALAAVWKAGTTGDGAAATLPLKRFDIAAGPLDASIEAYEKATGLSVKIVLPNGTLAGFNSPGVVGLYREDEALRRLLDGTGLNYRAEDATTMVVGVQAKDTV
jgi:catecholate siderophore receptor